MRSVRAPFGPCPGEDGKSPGRTKPCGQSRYVLDYADIILCRRSARPRARGIGGAAGLRHAPRNTPPLEVDRGGEEDLARVAVEGGQHPGLAKRRIESGLSRRHQDSAADELAGQRVLVEEVIAR